MSHPYYITRPEITMPSEAVDQVEQAKIVVKQQLARGVFLLGYYDELLGQEETNQAVKALADAPLFANYMSGDDGFRDSRISVPLSGESARLLDVPESVALIREHTLAVSHNLAGEPDFSDTDLAQWEPTHATMFHVSESHDVDPSRQPYEPESQLRGVRLFLPLSLARLAVADVAYSVLPGQSVAIQAASEDSAGLHFDVLGHGQESFGLILHARHSPPRPVGLTEI